MMRVGLASFYSTSLLRKIVCYVETVMLAFPWQAYQPPQYRAVGSTSKKSRGSDLAKGWLPLEMADPMTPERLDTCLRRLMSLKVPKEALAAFSSALHSIYSTLKLERIPALPGFPGRGAFGVLDAALPGLREAGVRHPGALCRKGPGDSNWEKRGLQMLSLGCHL